MQVNNHIISIDNLCYKPIAKEGCLVTSPLDYWKTDAKTLQNDPDIKKTAMCLGSDDDTELPCADKNGIPIIRSVVMGGSTCLPDTSIPCSPCIYNAKALLITFLLNNNDFTNKDSETWEKEVFEKNINDFNNH